MIGQTDMTHNLTSLSSPKESEINEILKAYWLSGYFSAKISQLVIDSLTEDTSSVLINKGIKSTLTLCEETDFTLDQLNTDKLFYHIKDSLKTLARIGYPFPEINLESTLNSDSSYTICPSLDRGPTFTYDSLYITGTDLVKKPYIYNLLGYKTGVLYNEDLLFKISDRLKQSNVVGLEKPISVIFKNNKAYPVIQLKKNKSSSFNGIIGIQPENGTTIITGLIELNLINSLKRGEEILVKWERFGVNNQLLNLKAELPYIFKSKIGLSGEVDLIRRDSSVNRLESRYGLIYDFNAFHKLGIGYFGLSNNQVQNQENFPLQNTSSSNYFFNYGYRKMDYTLNPRKGSLLKLEPSMGKRSVQNEGSKTNILTFSATVKKFIPVKKNGSLVLEAIGQTINGFNLLPNEQLLAGGINSLRGVDQNSLLVTSWTTQIIEYRYLFEQNSNFNFFIENHMNESNTLGAYTNDMIQSFGVGLNIGLKSGVFTFNYAIANYLENQFLLRNAKLNFGFNSTF